MTNGDKVRQMTDEEILEVMFGEEAFTIMRLVVLPNNMMQAIPMIQWMKMEAE